MNLCLKALRTSEDVSFRGASKRHSAEDVLAVVCEVLGITRDEVLRRQRDSMNRPLAALALCEHSGLTQREVAKVAIFPDPVSA